MKGKIYEPKKQHCYNSFRLATRVEKYNNDICQRVENSPDLDGLLVNY
jgi:hypothetical protein